MTSIAMRRKWLELLNVRRGLHLAQTLGRTAVPKLSPYDVSSIIRKKEFVVDFADGPVKSYETNQLGSNSPVEDSRSECSLVHNSGYLFGIYDGHGGAACAQVTAKRLLRYIAASLIAPNTLKQHLHHGARSTSFVTCYNDKADFVEEIREFYENSFFQFAEELTYENTSLQIHQAMENAFLRLDQDFSNEATENPNTRTLSVAMSGCVAVVAHIDENDLHVAGVGDCGAVLGQLTDTGQWVPKKLTIDHNTENVGEVRRILGEHPISERETVIRADRLLGQLAPLRALGDFRYKWSRDTLEKLVVPQFGEHAIPLHYHTPPYLSSRPEIMHHKLTPRDKFLVIGSDGLWDFMSPQQVVRLVGEHMSGKAFLQPLKLPKTDVTLGEISQMLVHRKAGLSKKPLDKNAATHLIRNALGGTEYGIEHSKLSHMLSLPQDIVRLFRDDITVTIVFFDSEYLRQCQQS